jgi:hypothetical protein
MAATALFDTNTLWNFAVVGRLELLEQRFAGRAAWTETVAQEVQDNAGRVPGFTDLPSAGWLGPPIEFDADDLGGIFGIQRILASPGDPRSKHLGEAESIYAMESKLAESVLVTDDRAAGDLARKRGHLWRNSQWVMSECFNMDEVGCPEAFEVLQQMQAAGRLRWIPDHHSVVC